VNLTTLSQVKALLELAETDWDGLLEELIAAISQRVGTYCNREFERQERVEYHDGGGRYLYLKCLPVTEIASVHGSDTWEWDESSLVPADHCQLLNAGMVAYRYGTWPYGPQALRVTYTGGYAEDAVPADLEMAVRTQAAYEFKRRKDIGLESVSFPDGSIQKVSSGEFLSMVKQVLDRYRIRPHG